MNITKKKQTHRYREQTNGYQWGDRRGGAIQGTGSKKHKLLRIKEITMGFPVVLSVKNLPANTGDVKDAGSIPRLGRSPGGDNGSPLQCSCLENPMHRGACRATVHRVAKSWTRLSTHR